MSNDTAQRYHDHLRQRARAYYPALQGGARVSLIEARAHKSSTMYRFEIGGGTESHRVLVKKPKTATARYRRAEQTEASLKFRLEYEALCAIHAHFRSLADRRFGAIRALDFIEEDSAIVAEESSDPSFRDVFMRSHRLRVPGEAPRLRQGFRNAGAWLRIYSDLPDRREAECHDADRDTLESDLMETTAYLARTIGDTDYFQNLAHRTVAEGRRVLPRSLPVGLKHGDYALRNLLVGDEGQVTGLDTQAKWRTPIYDDVAYFIVELETNWPQVLSQGLAFRADRLRDYSRRFLEGYFADARLPLDALRVFQTKMTCQKWAAHLFRLERIREEGRRSVRSTMRPLTNRFFKGYLDRIWSTGGE